MVDSGRDSEMSREIESIDSKAQQKKKLPPPWLAVQRKLPGNAKDLSITCYCSILGGIIKSISEKLCFESMFPRTVSSVVGENPL